MTLIEETNTRSKEVDADVERLREWLSKQPHLPHELDVRLLQSFVNGTNGLEIAKQKLDAWFTYRGKMGFFFSEEARNPLTREFREMSKSMNMFVLPKMTPKGYLVLWHQKGTDWDTFTHKLFAIKTIIVVEMIMALYPDNKGLVLVYDTMDIPSSLLAKLSPTVIASWLSWFQNTVPMKLKKLFVINAIPVVEVIMNTFVKPVMKEKLYKRVVVTTCGEEAVKETIPLENIPKDYGGSEKSSEELHADWVKLIEDNADWLNQTAQLISDENKRPPDVNNTYGIEGTFRSLAVD